MKKSAKLLSLLLALAMVFSLSTAALAADADAAPVTVKSSIREGKLLFLKDTFTVTASADAAADITLSIINNAGKELLGNVFRVADTQVSEDGKTTVYTIETVKIPGSYQKLNITATAGKGTQAPVTSKVLSFGVNLRNRIHVTVTGKASGEAVTDAAVQLMHQYPQWNKCPSLKFDAAKGEYVMSNAWDLCNQPFTAVNITVGDKTFTVDKTSDGRDLKSVITAGTEEIYVNYGMAASITVRGDDFVWDEDEDKGESSITARGDDFVWDEDEDKGESSITARGDDFVWDEDEDKGESSITARGDDFVWDGDEDKGESSITVRGDDFVWD